MNSKTPTRRSCFFDKNGYTEPSCSLIMEDQWDLTVWRVG